MNPIIFYKPTQQQVESKENIKKNKFDNIYHKTINRN